MKFEKGHSKTGGRKKGTANKQTKELREQLQQVVQNTLDELPGMLAELEPMERAKLLTSLLPYVLPRLNSVTAQVEASPMGNRPEWLDIAIS